MLSRLTIFVLLAVAIAAPGAAAAAAVLNYEVHFHPEGLGEKVAAVLIKVFFVGGDDLTFREDANGRITVSKGNTRASSSTPPTGA